MKNKRMRVREIATRLQTIRNIENRKFKGMRNPEELLVHHREWIETEMKNGPSGSGIDCGTSLNWERSKPNRLVLDVSFHHMDEMGAYSHWTDHAISVIPRLTSPFDLYIDGKNDNDIKDYLAEIYYDWLFEEIEIQPYWDQKK